MKQIIMISILTLSQSLMAKIADFNTMIEQQAKSQIETHSSLEEYGIKKVVVSEKPAKLTAAELVESDEAQEVVASTSTFKTNPKKALKVKLAPKPDDVEEKQFIQLGEEMNEASQ